MNKIIFLTICILLLFLDRIADRSRFYNLSNIGNDRLWLQNLLVDNNDSDDPDDTVTEEDLQNMLKLHLFKKKCQQQFLAAKNVNLSTVLILIDCIN